MQRRASSFADHGTESVARAGRVASRGAGTGGNAGRTATGSSSACGRRTPAPSRSASARRSTSSSAPTTGPGPGTCPRRAGDDYLFVVDGSRVARSVLSLAAGGRARAVPRPRHGRLRHRARPEAEPRRARDLRAARRNVLARGDVRRRDPAPRGAARARRHGDRADARCDVPRQSQLGLRRALHLRAASGVRRAARARATRRRRTPRRPRRDPRRRLQPHRARLGGDRRLRPVLHRPPRDVLGRGARLCPARRARVGDPERRAVDAGLQDRRPAPRRRARDLRRLEAARPRRAEVAASTVSSSPR